MAGGPCVAAGAWPAGCGCCAITVVHNAAATSAAANRAPLISVLLSRGSARTGSVARGDPVSRAVPSQTRRARRLSTFRTCEGTSLLTRILYTYAARHRLFTVRDAQKRRISYPEPDSWEGFRMQSTFSRRKFLAQTAMAGVALGLARPT